MAKCQSLPIASPDIPTNVIAIGHCWAAAGPELALYQMFAGLSDTIFTFMLSIYWDIYFIPYGCTCIFIYSEKTNQ